MIKIFTHLLLDCIIGNLYRFNPMNLSVREMNGAYEHPAVMVLSNVYIHAPSQDLPATDESIAFLVGYVTDILEATFDVDEGTIDPSIVDRFVRRVFDDVLEIERSLSEPPVEDDTNTVKPYDIEDAVVVDDDKKLN